MRHSSSRRWRWSGEADWKSVTCEGKRREGLIECCCKIDSSSERASCGLVGGEEEGLDGGGEVMRI